MDYQSFYDGRMFDAYRYLGAHVRPEGGTVFCTYAPGARRVTLIGEFNDWQEWDMIQEEHVQFWKITVAQASAGQLYKYVIYGADGSRTEHSDPYGFGMERPPAFASVIRDLEEYAFTDDEWMLSRTLNIDKPMNIYEMHLGSWLQDPEDPELFPRYDEIAQPLIDYVKANGYTHVEFLPLAEHPVTGSWGYQVTGFFSPTARYGTAAQLRKLIDCLHNAGIGAILDFVPAHFALDPYGLRRYDGTELYEYPSSDVTVSEWGSCNFIFARREVGTFMQSCANYWLAEYHFDGLRMDAVSRLLYWMGDEGRGVNETCVAFLKNMNHGLRCLHPTAMLIAEDSTSYPGCTVPADRGGLGFDYKWDLGWMHDTLDYFMKTSQERERVPEKLTFSMYYFYNERYLLCLSHDEVVHGKKTIIDKIYGSYEDKFPQLRCLYMLMMIHPGKKLNFMGSEIAMFREWDEEKEPDRFLLKYPVHDSFHHYMMELNELYLKHPAFWQCDHDPAGFQWIAMNDEGRCLWGLRRDGGGESLAVFLNLSDQDRSYWYEPVERQELTMLLHTDWERWSGTVKEEPLSFTAGPGEGRGIDLPRFSGILFALRPVPEESES